MPLGQHGLLNIVDAQGKPIAFTGTAVRSKEENEANARVIAALPELLTAAIEIDKLMENLFDAVPWGKTFDLDIEALNTVPLMLKRAIARSGLTPAPSERIEIAERHTKAALSKCTHNENGVCDHCRKD